MQLLQVFLPLFQRSSGNVRLIKHRRFLFTPKGGGRVALLHRARDQSRQHIRSPERSCRASGPKFSVQYLSPYLGALITSKLWVCCDQHKLRGTECLMVLPLSTTSSMRVSRPSIKKMLPLSRLLVRSRSPAPCFLHSSLCFLSPRR